MPQRNGEPLRGPTSAEYQHLLDENDALRLQLAKLRSDLKRKQRTITWLIEIINKDEERINNMAKGRLIRRDPPAGDGFAHSRNMEKYWTGALGKTRI